MKTKTHGKHPRLSLATTYFCVNFFLQLQDQVSNGLSYLVFRQIQSPKSKTTHAMIHQVTANPTELKYSPISATK